MSKKKQPKRVWPWIAHRLCEGECIDGRRGLVTHTNSCKDKARATRAATRLAQHLGPNWKIDVFENLGWRWCVQHKTTRYRFTMSEYVSGFWCSLMDTTPQQHVHQFQCRAATPNEARRGVYNLMLAYHAELTKAIALVSKEV